MKASSEHKLILVVRQTRLDDLLARFNTLEQARFYLERLGADFSDYRQEHDIYQAARQQLQRSLSSLGRLQVLERRFLPNYVFGQQDIVVVLGQDGLVANTLKYLSGQPVLGVNPDPQRWDGVLLPFEAADITQILPEVFKDRRPCKSVSMALAKLNDGQQLHAVNDLFIGQKTHVSARYLIRSGERQEQHSSSGIIISTGLGSSGWFKSLITGAQGIVQGMTAPKTAKGSLSKTQATQGKSKAEANHGMSWDADYLYYTVREPFPTQTTGHSLVFGKVSNAQPLRLVSQMPENGVIFSDGIEQDFVEFNAGTEAVISLANKQGRLVI